MGPARLFVRQENISVEGHDRRTGTVLVRRTFHAERPSCPRTVTVDAGTGDIFWSRTEVENSAIEAWLTSEQR